LVEFANPQSPAEMLIKSPTRITSQYHQVRTGGDTAAMMGVAKVLFDLDEKNLKVGRNPVLDHDFIRDHTHGFEGFKAAAKACEWQQIESRSGLTRGALEAAATVYAHANSVMFIYGMGLTQHKMGVETIQTMVNLALMRGNVGRQGAGICPVRGHSNVQGQRTVGITEKPEQMPADKLKELFGIDTPKQNGLNTVEACEKILESSVRAVVLLGGNLVRSIPEHRLMDPAWRKLRLTVQILTKLNRTARSWRDIVRPALSWPHRDRPSGKRAAGCLDGGQHRMHAWLARPGEAGEPALALRAKDRCRACQGGRAVRFDHSLGRLG
jgi:anaerobic selenocysteine-containing dehydrogenase